MEGEGRLRAVEAAKARCPKGRKLRNLCGKSHDFREKVRGFFGKTPLPFSRARSSFCANIHKLGDMSTTMICKIGFLDIVKLRDDGC